MVLARRRVGKRPTQAELRLLERGIPTDGQVEDEVGRRMLEWLEPALERLWRELYQRIQLDLSAGRVGMPKDVGVGQRARNEYEDVEFWRGISEEWEDLAANWIEATIPELAQYQAARYNFYVNMRFLNEQVLRYVQERYIPSLIRLTGDMSIVNSTRSQVRDIISRWQQGELPGGLGLPDLQQALAALFAPERARVIAVTEATRVYARGNQLAWLNAYKEPELEQAWGIVAMRWNTAADELVCPICRPLNGRQALLNQEFPVPDGIPPAHVGCRCWLTPIRDYNRAFHPPPVPSGPKGAMRRVAKPSRADIQAIRRRTGG